jgi:prophage regulatory protein
MPDEPVIFLREEQVRQRTGLSRSQRDVLEAENRFPRRVPLSHRAIGWVESEIGSWCAARIAVRDDQQLAAEARDARLPVPSRLTR